MAPAAKRAKTQVAKKPRTGPRLERPIGKGIPQTYRTSLRYVQSAVLPLTNWANVAFRCGSLYDPDYAVGGHQPYLFDQLAPLYNHYIVHKAKITVTFTGTGAAITRVDSPSTVVLFPDDNGTAAYTGKDTLLERPQCKFAMLPAFDVGSSVTKSLSLTYKKDKVFKNYMNTNLQAAKTTDPVEDHYFIFGGWNSNGPTASGIYYTAVIDYDTEFFERAEVSGS